MNSSRKAGGNRSRVRMRVGVLCIAACIFGAFSASAVAAPPSNDDFADALDLGNGSTASVSGTNRDATAEPGEPDHHGFRAIASVWYQWTAPADGRVRIDTCGSDFDTVLAVYTGPAIDVLRRVRSNDDWCDAQSAVELNATGGTTYRIAVDGYEGAEGSIALGIGPVIPPSNDSFADALDLGNGSTASVFGTNRDATAEPGEPDHHGMPAMASVWYRWTAPADRRVQIDTCASAFDTVLAVYTGSAIDALGPVRSNDDSCGVQSEVHFKAAGGTTYQIAVDGYLGDEGSIALDLGASNRFRIIKVRRNQKRGTAKLIVRVPGPGDLEVARTKRVKRATAKPQAARRVKLTVKPRGKARRALSQRASVKVRANVTYSPDDGKPNTETRRLKLVKSR